MNRLVQQGGLGVFDELRREMDHFLGRVVAPANQKSGQAANPVAWIPRLDLEETEKEYKLSVELPGVDEKDIELKVEDDRLIVSGSKKLVREEKKSNFHRIERISGSFHRELVLPADADRDTVDAQYDKGVLHVTITKRTPPTHRKIEVKRPSAN
jgi:HSP20 family protein